MVNYFIPLKEGFKMNDVEKKILEYRVKEINDTLGIVSGKNSIEDRQILDRKLTLALAMLSEVLSK